MATKALMMGDLESFQAISTAGDLQSAKAYGRGVRNSDQNLWTMHLADIAIDVVRQKFEADDECRQVLMTTGDKILAEAAPYDKIWGIGLRLNDARVHDPGQWQGKRVLGFALMKVRDHLRNRAAEDGHTLSGRILHNRVGYDREHNQQDHQHEIGQLLSLIHI